MGPVLHESVEHTCVSLSVTLELLLGLWVRAIGNDQLIF